MLSSTEKHFLPITLDEMRELGWEQADVVVVSGDAYIDHPSFGTAVIGRVIEAAGFRVAIIPQPNVPKEQEHGTEQALRDFCKFGKPRLFFGVTSGVMDSMVNHYTAARRLRHDDAYTPGGLAGFRPDYATYVYSRILKRLYPDVPVVIGGIEASMRRLTHYDYWSDRLKPSILMECHADLLAYGMAERTMVKIAQGLDRGATLQELHKLPQVGYVAPATAGFRATGSADNQADAEKTILLHSHEECLASKRRQAENFRHIERESNRTHPATLVQQCGDSLVVINPPEPPLTTEETDAAFDLPYMRQPHPKYKRRGAIPAFEMIKNSITIHRGCFGGCSFCAISAHQGKHIASRSEASIVMEAENLAKRPYFKGHISDLGGPSANMYKMSGSDPEKCSKCGRASCLVPQKCGNLKFDHRPATALYQKVASLKGVKHITIGSGIRYDMLIDDDGRKRKDFELGEYLRQVVANHVSGRLKVAPEHTDTEVLKLMRKPSFDNFIQFLGMFNAENRRCGKSQQLIPYFIAAHPGCTVAKMSELCDITRRFNLKTEQIQDFTPTPMTYATAMYYLGYDPYTGKKVHVAKSRQERSDQHLFFFAEKKENKQRIKQLRMNQKRRH
ncbi:MAG: YgiQ family radical SAM protein [Bacteroidales bacterium]|nr:YgiQ family radical SAM protein [Bacteroidales bacterium]